MMWESAEELPFADLSPPRLGMSHAAIQPRPWPKGSGGLSEDFGQSEMDGQPFEKVCRGCGQDGGSTVHTAKPYGRSCISKSELELSSCQKVAPSATDTYAKVSC
ncbi:hypothetical protein NDU88_002001 [Pleurodeles waltl]|uniref:Uncharacterized protein n=1 Tax=Pleurodeles waltl TaxID=8319 RepID=A0AAV7NE77_PLEWA|nr:hypothetical protein NDU88_002001 [Pleurodeles waltl]